MELFKSALGLEQAQDKRTFRSQLNELADEYERLLSESHRVSKENEDMREQLRQFVSESMTDIIDHDEEAMALEADSELPREHSTLLPKSMQGDLDSVTKECNKPVENGVLGDHKDEDCNSDSGSLRTSREVDFIITSEGKPIQLDSPEGSESIRRPLRTSGLGVLSRWFNPDSEETGMEGMMQSSPSMPSDQQYQIELGVDTDAPDWGTIWPLGRVRLTWDFIAFLCLLVELWATPFELVFLQEIDTPLSLQVISHCITSFFAVDIALNFSTGYIEGDVTIMRRPAIVKTYLKFWFWIDLISTLPFDLLARTVAGNMFSIARFGKISKALKILRYLKMVRAIRLIKTMKQARHLRRHFQILEPLRAVMQPIQVLIFLMLLAHVHGVVWAAMQPDWVSVTSVAVAWERYYRSFNWAYILFTLGVIGDASTQTPAIWTLEMILASERLGLIVLAFRQVILHSLAYVDDAQKGQTHKDLLTYFRRHNVSLQTQIQVMFSLTDVTAAKKQQQYHGHLDDLPNQLAKVLRIELWSDRLESMGLVKEVAGWHVDFLTELCQVAAERVLPSRCFLIHEGCAAVASYYILEGEVNASIGDGSVFIPPFKKGMWVGENAFVSPSLRYSATFSSKSRASFMVIRGSDFLQLISRLGLMDRFQAFCAEELWKGLCGRCGSLGDHFSDKCPATYGPQMFPKEQLEPTYFSEQTPSSPTSPNSATVTLPFRRRSNSVTSLNSSIASVASRESHASRASWMSAMNVFANNEEKTSPQRKSSTKNLMGRGLRRLLQEIGLEHLAPIFISMRVNDLDDLEHFNVDLLRMSLPDGQDLSPEQERGLSPKYVQAFRERSSRTVKNTLFRYVSRLHHLMFLSHYKLEAGTEAALMRTELEQAIADDAGSPGQFFDDPVFLDSDNLQSLSDLKQRVKNSHNIVLLLTAGVLSRPWCLVEIVTAKREGVRVLPVIVSKPGQTFSYPDEAFYERLRHGKFLDEGATEVLAESNCNLSDVEDAIKSVFDHIALPYSPHKGKHIRKAEIEALLKQCRLKTQVEQRVLTPSPSHNLGQSLRLNGDTFGG